MSVLTRVTDFVPSTLIKSQEMDDELNQLVNLLSGVSTSKDTLLKFSDGSNPVLRVDQLGAGLIQQWLNNGTARASLSALGKLLLPAGIGSTPTSISTDFISNFGTYFIDPTVRATPASTTETDFSSRTLAANTLANDGDCLVILTGVNFAANANNKTYRISFAGNNVYTAGPAAFNGTNLIVMGYLYRRSSTSLSGFIGSIATAAGASTGVQFTDVGSQNFATTNILKSTGQNGTASANDMQQFGFIVLKGSV